MKIYIEKIVFGIKINRYKSMFKFYKKDLLSSKLVFCKPFDCHSERIVKSA